jgi:hypothetical protein
MRRFKGARRQRATADNCGLEQRVALRRLPPDWVWIFEQEMGRRNAGSPALRRVAPQLPRPAISSLDSLYEHAAALPAPGRCAADLEQMLMLSAPRAHEPIEGRGGRWFGSEFFGPRDHEL